MTLDFPFDNSTFVEFLFHIVFLFFSPSFLLGGGEGNNREKILLMHCCIHFSIVYFIIMSFEVFFCLHILVFFYFSSICFLPSSLVSPFSISIFHFA
jgi:hypothetical protein